MSFTPFKVEQKRLEVLKKQTYRLLVCFKFIYLFVLGLQLLLLLFDEVQLQEENLPEAVGLCVRVGRVLPEVPPLALRGEFDGRRAKDSGDDPLHSVISTGILGVIVHSHLRVIHSISREGFTFHWGSLTPHLSDRGQYPHVNFVSLN